MRATELSEVEPVLAVGQRAENPAHGALLGSSHRFPSEPAQTLLVPALGPEAPDSSPSFRPRPVERLLSRVELGWSSVRTVRCRWRRGTGVSEKVAPHTRRRPALPFRMAALKRAERLANRSRLSPSGNLPEGGTILGVRVVIPEREGDTETMNPCDICGERTLPYPGTCKACEAKRSETHKEQWVSAYRGIRHDGEPDIPNSMERSSPRASRRT